MRVILGLNRFKRVRMTTIREVAREARVSVGTVSNVLNDPAIVSPETCERVLRIMRRRNYRPSAIARSLSTGRTRTFGLVVTGNHNPFFAGIVQGAGEVARETGCSLLIACAEDDCRDLPLQVQMLRQQWVDGIFLATQPLPEAAWRELHFGRTPVVIMDRGQLPRQAQASLVGFDWTMAGPGCATPARSWSSPHRLRRRHPRPLLQRPARRTAFARRLPHRASYSTRRCTATATISRKVAASAPRNYSACRRASAPPRW